MIPLLPILFSGEGKEKIYINQRGMKLKDVIHKYLFCLLFSSTYDELKESDFW